MIRWVAFTGPLAVGRVNDPWSGVDNVLVKVRVVAVLCDISQVVATPRRVRQAKTKQTLYETKHDAHLAIFVLEKLATEKNTLVMEKSKLQCSLNDLHLKNEELQSEVQKLQMSNLRLTEDISSSRTIAGEKLDALNEQIESEKDKVAQAMDKLKQSKADHSAKKKHSIRHVTEEKAVPSGSS